MSAIPPIPVVFQPIFKPKPWGGRELATLFGKELPDDDPIGESWEVADLPDSESQVAGGPLAGRRLDELVKMWGPGLLGDAELVSGRFPLLIKFLDARQRLSIQVHPHAPRDSSEPEPPDVKREAWYIVAAAPQAELYIGLKPEVGPEDVRAAGTTAALVDLLHRRPAQPGRCYYLPAGVPHAMGMGLVVAEVQTPSDITYRLYDWNRMGLDGRPRSLHLEQALANIDYAVPEAQIVQRRTHVADLLLTVTRLVRCQRFSIDKLRFSEGYVRELPDREMRVWIMLSGEGRLVCEPYQCELKPGDVAVIPADSAETRVETVADCELLEVKLPGRSAPP